MKISANPYITKDIERKFNGLIEAAGVNIPSQGKYQSPYPFGSLLIALGKVQGSGMKLEASQEKDLKEVSAFVIEAAVHYETTGKVRIYGDEDKLGYFLRSGRFEYTGKSDQ